MSACGTPNSRESRSPDSDAPGLAPPCAPAAMPTSPVTRTLLPAGPRRGRCLFAIFDYPPPLVCLLDQVADRPLVAAWPDLEPVRIVGAVLDDPDADPAHIGLGHQLAVQVAPVSPLDRHSACSLRRRLALAGLQRLRVHAVHHR